MERYALHFLACRAVASLSRATEWLTSKAVISMTTPLEFCVLASLNLSLNFHPSPRWNVTCSVFGLQGGGLSIRGTATLTNTNVYSNHGSWGALTFCPCLDVSSIAPLNYP